MGGAPVTVSKMQQMHGYHLPQADGADSCTLTSSRLKCHEWLQSPPLSGLQVQTRQRQVSRAADAYRHPDLKSARNRGRHGGGAYSRVGSGHSWHRATGGTRMSALRAQHQRPCHAAISCSDLGAPCSPEPALPPRQPWRHPGSGDTAERPQGHHGSQRPRGQEESLRPRSCLRCNTRVPGRARTGTCVCQSGLQWEHTCAHEAPMGPLPSREQQDTSMPSAATDLAGVHTGNRTTKHGIWCLSNARHNTQ